jgi:hypothetical protein
MFLFVVGLPGCFSEWCDAITSRLAERTLGPTEIVDANTLEELSRGVMKLGVGRAVIAARQPRGSLRRALVDAGRCFVVALEDPRIALGDLILGHGLELPAAVRAVAGGCAAVKALVSSPGALTLQSDRDWSQGATAAAAIARHLQIAISNSEVVELIGNLPTRGSPDAHNVAAWWKSLKRAEQDAVTGALAPYIEDPNISESRPISWTRDLFLLGDRPDQRAAGAIDITGRARCLVHGPHIMLPLGRWSLSLKLQFSRAAADRDFSLEVLAGTQLASRTIRPPAEGIVEVSLVFAVDELNDDPIDIRLSNVRPAFDGTVALIGATLARQTEVVLVPDTVEAAC